MVAVKLAKLVHSNGIRFGESGYTLVFVSSLVGAAPAGSRWLRRSQGSSVLRSLLASTPSLELHRLLVNLVERAAVHRSRSEQEWLDSLHAMSSRELLSHLYEDSGPYGYFRLCEAQRAPTGGGGVGGSPPTRSQAQSQTTPSISSDTWIEVQVLNQREEPVPSLRYEVELSDNTFRSALTDGQGCLHYSGIPPGTCLVRLEPANRVRKHIVRDGDWMESIAQGAGLSVREILEDPANEELMAERDNPNLLHPGDEVTLPYAEKKSHVLATGKRHVLRIEVPTAMFRFHLDAEMDDEDQGGDESPPPVRYELIIEGRTSLNGEVKRGDPVELELPVTVRSGTLKLCLDPSDPEGELEVPVSFSGLSPISETEGVQARLSSLGFDVGPVDGELGERSQAALRAFVATRSESEEAEAHEDLERAKIMLREEYGC